MSYAAWDIESCVLGPDAVVVESCGSKSSFRGMAISAEGLVVTLLEHSYSPCGEASREGRSDSRISESLNAGIPCREPRFTCDTQLRDVSTRRPSRHVQPNAP